MLRFLDKHSRERVGPGRCLRPRGDARWAPGGVGAATDGCRAAALRRKRADKRALRRAHHAAMAALMARVPGEPWRASCGRRRPSGVGLLSSSFRRRASWVRRPATTWDGKPAAWSDRRQWVVLGPGHRDDYGAPSGMRAGSLRRTCSRTSSLCWLLWYGAFKDSKRCAEKRKFTSRSGTRVLTGGSVVRRHAFQN